MNEESKSVRHGFTLNFIAKYDRLYFGPRILNEWKEVDEKNEPQNVTLRFKKQLLPKIQESAVIEAEHNTFIFDLNIRVSGWLSIWLYLVVQVNGQHVSLYLSR